MGIRDLNPLYYGADGRTFNTGVSTSNGISTDKILQENIFEEKYIAKF
jgi:hypothetical protein